MKKKRKWREEDGAFCTKRGGLPGSSGIVQCPSRENANHAGQGSVLTMVHDSSCTMRQGRAGTRLFCALRMHLIGQGFWRRARESSIEPPIEQRKLAAVMIS